ncbi:UDP-3-O-acyl-N-acetylglucosamine deacetylase [Paracoccus suum]|uniref:UDP-3-O-acyl-N-acetylglucosamine deacetylase n=1 Tax=Paracoccus suum TaxID=2259340 RepID=A0A344PH72_9RHOB|nr:UDP-3-O-acyl-N-acetylglucosamine deacetylase [Paracoccus suum]AXC48727.1 UDP-3-O-acyl-N-acetylglucosamine deacetylase [Paracoccus suum]
MQATLNQIARFRGVGLHSGASARLAINPAPENHGIVFRRTDLPGRPTIPALWDRVVPTPLCTRLQGEDGVTISTIEHVMAALAGTGVHNALIDLDGPEVPILDGSAQPFVEGILDAGIRRQSAPLRVIRVLRPVTVSEGGATETLEPADQLEIDFSIDFTEPAIGRQHKRLDMVNGRFVSELMDSRTFCRQADVAAMQSRGQALGGTYFNAVVVDGARVLTPGGLRHADEPVRHKMLDAMGDLALAGAPLLGRLTANRGGHALTNRLLRALFADPEAYAWEVCAPALTSRLPGAGLDLHPVPSASQGLRALATA